MDKKDNFEIDVSDGSVFVRVNPRLYPLEVVYSAAYCLLDRAYVVLDGDPQKEILVKMRSSAGKADAVFLEKIARDFNNELINYTVYAIQSERNREVRDAIVKRALLGMEDGQCSDSSAGGEDEKCTCASDERSEGKEACSCASDAEYEKDPLGIRKPWSEQAGRLEKKDAG